MIPSSDVLKAVSCETRSEDIGQIEVLAKKTLHMGNTKFLDVCG